MKLTPHFSLAELTFSATAQRKQINNAELTGAPLGAPGARRQLLTAHFGVGGTTYTAGV